MADKDTDIKKIKELIEIMKANGLEELEIKHGDNKIFLKRSQPQQIQTPAIPTIPIIQSDPGVISTGQQGMDISSKPGTPQQADQEEELIEIKSPIVGTFYAKPTPDSEPYVEVGSTVNPQTIVCIIEAMKVMNEIKAETSGIIAEVLVTNGQAVEYGQVLFKVRPD